MYTSRNKSLAAMWLKNVLWYLMMNADQDLFMNCYLFLNLNGCFKTHMLTMLFKQLFEFLRYGNQLPVINTFFLSNSLVLLHMLVYTFNLSSINLVSHI